MQTLLNVIVDTAEENTDALSAESAVAYHKIQKNKIIDLLHIALNGVCSSIQTLDKVSHAKEGAA